MSECGSNPTGGDRNLRLRRAGTITSSQAGSRGRAECAVTVKAMGPVLEQKGESQCCLQEVGSKEGNEGQSRGEAGVGCRRGEGSIGRGGWH